MLQTRRAASWLAERMSRDGHAVGLLSGELTILQRADIIRRFKEGKEKVLITTNVAARGEEPFINLTNLFVFSIPFDLLTINLKLTSFFFLNLKTTIKQWAIRMSGYFIIFDTYMLPYKLAGHIRQQPAIFKLKCKFSG